MANTVCLFKENVCIRPGRLSPLLLQTFLQFVASAGYRAYPSFGSIIRSIEQAGYQNFYIQSITDIIMFKSHFDEYLIHRDNSQQVYQYLLGFFPTQP